MDDVMCGNGACGCRVDEEDVYCSEQCEVAASQDEGEGATGCACPHADCQSGADVEPVAYTDLGDADWER